MILITPCFSSSVHRVRNPLVYVCQTQGQMCWHISQRSPKKRNKIKVIVTLLSESATKRQIRHVNVVHTDMRVFLFRLLLSHISLLFQL